MSRSVASSLMTNKYVLLTKRESFTGRISARGLDSINLAALGPFNKEHWGLMLS